MNVRQYEQASALGLAILLLSGCTQQPSNITLNPNDVVSQDALINSLDSLARNIGRYDITVPVPPGACPTHILAYVSDVDLEYKVATNVTVGASAGGNIPVGPFILTPSVNGSHSKIQTETRDKKFTFTPNDLIVHHSISDNPALIAGNSLSVTSGSDQSGYGEVRDALIQDVQVYLNRDHSQHPCIKPGDSTLSSALQVENKAGGGLTLNFIVAQVGGTATSTNDWTQTVKFTFKFSPSSAAFF
jgi:hypothetical protein